MGSAWSSLRASSCADRTRRRARLFARGPQGYPRASRLTAVAPLARHFRKAHLKLDSLVLLLGWLVRGGVVRQLGKTPPELAPRLNWWVLNIALPALVLDLIPSVKMDSHLWFMPIAMWLVFLGGWAFAAIIGRALHWSNARIGATALAAGLGNTALVGFPLIEMLRHKEALPFAALSDQLG